jgi:hypothetical protein
MKYFKILLHNLSEENHEAAHTELSSFQTYLLQDKQFTYNIKLWRLRVTIVVVEKQ